MFQHTAARRRLPATGSPRFAKFAFQHTAARRRLLPELHPDDFSVEGFNTQPREGGYRSVPLARCKRRQMFQHTAARRRLPALRELAESVERVSTHSRTEAAANTKRCLMRHRKFQHTAARRRLHDVNNRIDNLKDVSTHSRAEAAAQPFGKFTLIAFCFNTQPRGGGCR